ncbi:PQQ-binding-like beta-propeller repeat protein [Miltoncostaea marina]|uniref:outer membrane protein assembly factor BamB family protein n=1 Tax=Miltoncostaea marina TaxID=2843215 RepID=UPI001C3E5133|nr:PQQ-binding-like beta-propeller repeat protein [Miltoncostaea marina]
MPPTTVRPRPGLLRAAAVLVLAAAAVLAGVACGSDDDDEGAVPAFSAEQLAAPPGADWITNGGSTMNQRYSPASRITPENVGGLKGVWRARLDGSGTAAKYSGEAQPIVYGDTMYVITGADDVFALDVATGEKRWVYEAKLDPGIDTVCCGWTSRGVAIGDGRVYVGQIDGKLVALDAETGEVDWETQAVSWQRGETITSAPLYWEGRVYSGMSGGEFGVRGRVMAFDAETGEEEWRFWTIPGPGETGHDSWPQDNEAWKTGGAPVWQTPSIDPELGLLYFSTGNASPDLDGSAREGDNLFAASMVAIDARTGEYRWHFQQVHHDIWDYDAPSPTVLFDVEIDGRTRHGIAEASKTGWLYMLDRETGEPLLPIPERPVPQSARQKTSPTQPIPSYPPFISHRISDEAYGGILKALRSQAGEGERITPPPRAKQVFTPPDATLTVMTPGPAGGVNWPPTSYNPKTGMFYVCAQDSVAGFQFERSQEFEEGSYYIGSVLSTVGFGASPGVLAAIDAATGRIAWSKRWPESCYSGTTTTGGGLVYVGRNSGHLEAYDARTGERRWRFQTGAGANSTASVFERDGTEYVAFYAAGNSLAASPHGDNVWLFSLDGTLAEATEVGPGTGTGHGGQGGGAEPESGDPDDGRTVFAENCSSCHGADGRGGNGGPDLSKLPNARVPERVAAKVRNGGNGMPAFRDTLTPNQINDVAAYVANAVAAQP